MSWPKVGSRRAAALCAALLLVAAAAAHGAPPLPARNLRVETRVVDELSVAGREAHAAAAVTVTSSGHVEGAAAVSVRSGGRDAGVESLQRLLVMNGMRATFRLTQVQSADDTEVFWTPWGPGAAVRSLWVEVADGMEVWPRWSGGAAPALVDLGAQHTQAQTQRAPPQLTLFTTVQAPLGEWVEVARLHRRAAGSVSAGYGAATSSRERSLQLRVSLP